MKFIGKGKNASVNKARFLIFELLFQWKLIKNYAHINVCDVDIIVEVRNVRNIYFVCFYKALLQGL